MRNYFLWVIPTMKYYCDKVVILLVSFGQNLPSLSNWFDESGRFSSSSPSTYPNVCWQLHVRCYPPLIWTICSKSRRFFHMWSPPVISLLVILISTINPSYIGYSDITGHQLELVSVHKNDKFSVKSPLILAHQFHHVGSCRILSNGKGTFQEAQYLI